MKRYKKSILILIALGLLAAVMLINNSREGFRKKSNIFAVNDTTNITKFFLADKNNNTVKVTRSDNGEWILNDKYSANPAMVHIMLKTFIGIDIKAPVAKSARNTIIRVMAGKSVKTEIYQRVYRINIFDWIKLFPHEKLTRTYYVGDATMDNSGTFMLMQGTEEPYIVNIPGFRGFVSTRYSAMEADWRNHSVFKFRIPEIQSVSVRFFENPEKSYLITNENNRSFTLTSLSDNRNMNRFDTLKVVEYLHRYHDLNYESILNDMTKSKRDSIISATPTYEVELVDKLGKTHSLKTWKRAAYIGQLDLDGNQAKWDLERMYALIDNSEYLVVIQYFVFNDILVPLQWFAPPESQNRMPAK
jgi:hypothetical protein